MKCERLLILPDIHCPYHDPKALDLVERVARKTKFDRLIDLGDFADFYSVSFFDRNPTRCDDLEWEIREGNLLLDRLDALGIHKKHYVLGNHEYRLERYLAKNAPALFNMVKVERLFRLRERGWGWTPYQDTYHLGKLHITHDLNKAGKRAHDEARAEYEGNAVIGHTHWMGISYQGNARGECHVGAMFGWLGALDKIDYTHRVKALKWQLGFGTGLYEVDTGVVHLQAHPIIDYRVAIDGTVIALPSSRVFSTHTTRPAA